MIAFVQCLGDDLHAEQARREAESIEGHLAQ